MKVRNLTRIATAALLAVGAVTCAATPALAAEVDLGLDVRSFTDGVVTSAIMKVTNNGTGMPKAMSLAVDTSAIDKSHTTIIAPQQECAPTATGFECGVKEGDLGVPQPGQSRTLNIVFWATGDKSPGAVGDLRVTLTVEGDAENASVPIVMPALRGPVLQSYPQTVTQMTDDYYNGKAIPPGARGVTYVDIFNRGSRSAVGVRTVGRLPEGVSFVTDGLDNCEFTADKRTATCAWEGNKEYTLIPWIIDDTMDQFPSSTRVQLPFVVDKDVKGPVKLAGGEWEFAPIAVEDPELDTDIRNTLLGNAPTENKAAPKPIDHFGYALLIGAGATGEGSGGGSDEPSLPITGPGSATVAGTGGALVALGVFLLFAIRRRRTIR
jgi:MYXO-CTERM domain-containing protein